VLAFGPFLSQMSDKGRLPVANVFGRVEKGIAQRAGTKLLHVWITVFELSRLVGGRRHSSIGQPLIRGVELGKIASLGEDPRTHTISHAWNGGDWRMEFLFLDFRVQFLDEPDGMLQFKGLSGHSGSNGTFCGIPSVTAMRGVSQQSFSRCKMCGCNLLGSGELRQQGINRSRVKRRHQLLQFREQDTHKPGNGLLPLNSFFHLVKTVSGE